VSGDTATAAIRAVWAEAALAVAAFTALCAVVLPVAPQAAEPDDGAYRASIVAITDWAFSDVVDRRGGNPGTGAGR